MVVTVGNFCLCEGGAAENGAPHPVQCISGVPKAPLIHYFLSCRLVKSVWYSTDITPFENRRRSE